MRCKHDNCINDAVAKGLCKTHYNIARRSIETRPTCAIDGCFDLVEAKGLCYKHYWESYQDSRRKMSRVEEIEYLIKHIAEMQARLEVLKNEELISNTTLQLL